jgi:uncharacterized protein YjbI with pentapeptide repeats
VSRFALNATILLTTAFALTSNAYALKHDALERLVTTGACQRCDLNYADLAKADLSGADLEGPNCVLRYWTKPS